MLQKTAENSRLFLTDNNFYSYLVKNILNA